jgi:hypothetical protein
MTSKGRVDSNPDPLAGAANSARKSTWGRRFVPDDTLRGDSVFAATVSSLDRRPPGSQVDLEFTVITTQTPRHAERRRIYGRDLETSRKRGLDVAKPYQIEDPLDDRSPECDLDLQDGVVVPIDRAPVAGFGHCLMVILTGEQANVVDLRDPARE